MLTINTRVNHGRLPSQSSEAIRKFLEKLEGKQIEINIKQVRKTRSLDQNAYYHKVIVGMVRDALEELGHELSHLECHEWLKGKFNYASVANKEGEYIADLPKSTASLSTTDFNDYNEKIRRWSAEILKTYIPLPNEQLTIYETQ